LIPYKELTKVIPKGLREHLDVTIIQGNQTAPAPAYPYGSYNVTTIATANRGTWQKHPDGIDRKLVRSIWSLSFLSDDWDESVELAIKAREWFEHTGRVWLAEQGVTVQSTTDINNRDNLLTVEYERKNGFDVVLYVYDEVNDPTSTTGYIEDVEINHERTN
jgi:hypothetical protein